jgi:hypothetical protein
VQQSLTETRKGGYALRTWLAEQQRATIFNSKDCERAAALYAAGRGAEAEQAIAHLPPQIKHAMMALFEKGFPEPQNMDATVRALLDPEFPRWVQSKLLPMVAGAEEKKSA